MGTGSRSWALLWALEALLMVWLAESQGQEDLSMGNTEPSRDNHRRNGAYLTSSPAWPVTFSPITIVPSTSSWSPAHNGRVCSTWGDFHYKTFDGDVFRFPGLCNYVFSAHCGAAYEDFNLQLRRSHEGSSSTISRIVLKAQGLVLELSNSSVLIDGQREELPYSRAGFLVEHSGDYVKVRVQLLLTFLWNGRDSALLELDSKYANQTCGLCGDFNGFPASNEFFVHNTRLTPFQFGNLQKLDGPMEQCQDPPPSLATNCTYKVGPRRHSEQEAPTNNTEDSSFGCGLEWEDICHCTLLGPAFAECNKLVDANAYVAACVQDLCHCPTCPCATFAEYSRQCAQAGGQPQNWRGPELCPRTCPLNMQHQECGSPCVDTCSNPQRSQLCEDHCVAGCFCPPGMVLDDITLSGCLPLAQCPCTHSGHTYMPGTSFTTTCSSCTCSGGLWQCRHRPCPGTCSVQGGSHISTYDKKLYDVHGDCSYILSKKCADGSLAVLAELRKCGLTDTENCLRAVTLSLHGGDTTIRIQASGGVFVNSIYTQLPVLAANITIFRPTSFFILVQTDLGLQVQVQLVPLMQVYVRLDPSHHGQMCGLCGNFNQNQADDFMALSGVVEGTGAAFANTWKTQASCPDAKSSFEDPCSLSVENENYAQHWCSLLTNHTGPFSACHSTVNPSAFYSNCVFDTCNCEKSEDCLCAALSSYVQACAAEGVLLRGWRAGVCAKYMSNCPKSQSYKYAVDTCPPTCRALSEADATCSVSFVPVDGCTCPEDTFLNEAGVCVPAQECPCHLHGTMVAPGEIVEEHGMVCSCADGKLSCLGALTQETTFGCTAPMMYLDCSNVSAGTPGAECLRSCHSLDMDCFSTHCVSGCVCPPGLVADGSGGCVAKEDCPCIHNEASYKPGATIRVNCNTCTCRDRRWECSSRPCLGTCVAYGDGHFITFDGERYRFQGSCQYTLAQDYCGGSGSPSGTFRITTENVPCGTTGTSCSKAIRLFLGSYEMILHEGTFKVVERGQGGDLPYKIRYMGIFLVVETRSGLVVSWDRKTSVFLGLQQHYKGRVCGLCGNFDGNSLNDFTTRSQAVVSDALEFGNSWKFSPTCPDALVPKDPCTTNPYRKAWAQKQCSLIHSATFATCHSQVDSTKYYEACMHDVCACDAGGDCECFCTAVAAYAQACQEAGVCVSWRTPDICPLFCDYYNPHGECEWHYQPCGAPCLRTCRNPSAHCLFDMPGLEGCYPKCPPSQPFFDEDQMKCVAQCGCYDEDGNYYDIGTQVPTTQNCQSCHCSPGGLQCSHSPSACTCTYEGHTYGYGDTIYSTTDGLGACLTAVCGNNGTIIRRAEECAGVPSTTPFTFTPSTTSSVPTESTLCVREVCHWSSWYDSSRPEPGAGGGDVETFGNLRQKGYQVCQAPAAIECRAQLFPSKTLQELGQKVTCDTGRGLTCTNSEQSTQLCHNYELRVLCCVHVPCGPSPAPSASPLSSWSTAQGTCQPRCKWTEWFDTDYPKSEEDGGDTETYDSIKKKGGNLCEQPQDIQCETQLYPGQTPEQVGQRVKCDIRYGLRCRNKDQEGSFPMCYNYRIRVLCCSRSHCVGQESTGPLATTQGETTESTQVLSSEPSLVTPRLTLTTATTTTKHCQSRCEWTQWFDSDFPTSGVDGGDVETFENIRATGGKMCQQPQQIECRAEDYPEVSMDQIGQVVTCDPQVGLLCRNKDQPGEFKVCFNYNVRVLCCDSSHCPGPASPQPTTAQPTTPSTTQATTPCQPRCEWTQWFDSDFPTSGVDGGDVETFENIRATGGKMCQQPQQIECRAEDYPEVSMDQIGQVVTCDPQVGLLCRNKDQPGEFKVCFNYNVRVLCCDSSHCLGPASPLPTTAQPTTPSTTQATTPCQPRCEWTQWFDSDFPTSGVDGGDVETFENIRATGGKMCQQPQQIECRAEDYPEVSMDQIGQVVTCDPQVGLLCRNKDQPGEFKVCFNYNVRVLCCDSSHCPGPASPQPTTAQPTTPSTTQATTPCQPRCEWTQWFDSDFPTSGVDGGDVETFENIRATGGKMCQQPQQIECRAEDYPEVSMDQIGQVVTCDPQVGLLCRNKDQPGEFKVCFNYNVRVLCCDSSHCPGPASPQPTTAQPTTPSTTQATTPCQPRCEWTQWFDSDFPTSGVDGGDVETFENIRATGGKMCQQPQQIECRAEDYPEVSMDQIGQVVTCDPQVGLLCRNKDQSGEFKVCFNYNVRVLCCDSSHCPGPASPQPTTAQPTTPSTTQATTPCQPRCEWTQWFDSDFPTSGVDGGDVETFENIRATGGKMCQQPQQIECRAEDYPEVSMDQIGQVVTCDPQVGLLCRNKDQPGEFKVCFNYNVRVLCCDSSHCPGPASPQPTTAQPTTPSTTQATTPCQPRCEWTQWFDSDFPTSGVDGGDVETFENMRATGGKMCQQPQQIECRAEDYPEVSMDQIGQVVTCDPQVGLLCRNKDQPGEFKVCFNYNVRVLCCDSSHCLGPASPLPTTAQPTTPSTTQATTPCQPRCEWTQWFDSDFPTSGVDGGDVETFENIRATGGKMCQQPQQIECRAEDYPEVSMDQIGQVVTCDPQVGLLCRNKDQPGEFKVCFNYNVRVLCCDSSHCPGPASPQPTTAQPTTPSTTQATTPCQPRCEWTQWFDSDFPTSGVDGGDVETFENIRATGGKMCQQPQQIECRAEDYPEVSMDQIGQVVTCDPQVGLLCRNKDQPGEFKVCFNYNVRVLCCDSSHCPGPASPQPTTAQPTTPSTTQATTPCQPRCEWTQWFDSDFPTSGVDGGDVETFENIRATGGKMCQQPQQIECRAEDYPEVSMDQIGQVVTCDPQVGLLCRNKDQPGEFKVCFNYNVRVLCCDSSHCLGPASPLPTTAQPTTPSTTQATTPCQPRCEWTQWFDSDFPTSGVDGGDVETFENIRATGGKMCQQPQQIECRAEDYPEVSMDQIRQVVTCDPQVGLLCRNKDQSGEFKVCFNYNVRVLCCDSSHCPGPASPLPTTAQPTTPSTTQATTPCQPRCEWTQWFDSDFPTSGVDGGDVETFENIRATGGKMCQQPQQIECRAEDYPEVSMDQIGQVVTCDPQVGLLCRNKDQSGEFKVCFNYNVRVLCCDSSHCPGPASPHPTSTWPSTPSLVPPGWPFASSISSTPPSPCFCLAFGQLFSAGQIIYNETDGAGCHFSAVCTGACDIERFAGTCPTSSSTTSSTPVSPPSEPLGCDNAVPPRQVNESWTLENCTVARCEGNNRVVLLEPVPVASITCVNQHLPIKVWSQSQPCLFHYECECLCSGWGRGNFMTFDGTWYSFTGSCTYTLLREIYPRHGNLSILLANHCKVHNTTSCPRALQVYYESTEIILTTTTSTDSVAEESLILFNQMRVSRGFSKNGISVSVSAATTMGIHIPAIGASVTFNGHDFQIQLPYGYFGHNMEGQCGTCTNSQSDDCRRPDGTIAPTCQDMAKSWVVPGSSTEDCLPVSTSPQPLTGSTPSSTPCPPAPLCKLMLSPVFAECHSLIPPGPFFQTCVSEGCQDGPLMLCQNLEVYAALCRHRGVCVDWRNATSGLCDLPCPPTKVYRPCGPMQPASCDSRTHSPLSSRLAEGCFCPEDQLLFSLSTDICVHECSCVGPDGSPKFLGEQWVSNCQSCVCDKGSASVRCRPVQCQAQDLPPQCGQPGVVALTRPQANNPCCSETLCVCNVTTCPQDPPECGPEQELTYTQEKGNCCPNFSCRPKLCNYNGTVYGVGATFPGVVPCHTCVCLSTGAQAPTVQCEVACTTTCPEGFEYSRAARQCVPITCFTPEGQSVQPNEIWVSSHVDNCIEYRCEAKSGVPMLTPRPKPCPDVSNCRGILRKAGCCYACEERDLCQVHGNLTILRYQGCETVTVVNVTFCEGSCPGVSRYLMEAQAMQHQCTCCQETRTHREAVTMRCPDGTDIRHTYTQVDECGCSPACLSAQAPVDTHN